MKSYSTNNKINELDGNCTPCKKRREAITESEDYLAQFKYSVELFKRQTQKFLEESKEDEVRALAADLGYDPQSGPSQFKYLLVNNINRGQGESFKIYNGNLASCMRMSDTLHKHGLYNIVNIK